MSKILFTQEQMEELLKNPFVTACREKTISYSKEFKVSAVKRYEEEGISASQLFVEAGFNLQIIGTRRPKQQLSAWRKIYKTKGEIGLSEEHRGKTKGGGRPKTKGITDADKIARMETEIAYLKAENAFLAKLRAKRRE